MSYHSLEIAKVHIQNLYHNNISHLAIDSVPHNLLGETCDGIFWLPRPQKYPHVYM